MSVTHEAEVMRVPFFSAAGIVAAVSPPSSATPVSIGLAQNALPGFCGARFARKRCYHGIEGEPDFVFIHHAVLFGKVFRKCRPRAGRP
jgi:hypothetical protein